MSEPIFQFGIRKFSSVFPFMSLSHPEKNPSSDSRSYLDGEGCLEKRTWGITKVTVPSGATYFRFDVPLLYSLYTHTYNFVYLFLAVLCLWCCTLAFLSVVSGGYSSLQCTGFSLWWLLLLQNTGSRVLLVSSCSSWTL